MSSASKGGEWTNKIYFDPEADKAKGDTYFIKEGDLIEKLKDIVDPN